MKKDNVFQAAMRVLKKNSQLRTGVSSDRLIVHRFLRADYRSVRSV